MNLWKKLFKGRYKQSAEAPKEPEHPYYPVPRSLKEKSRIAGDLIGHSQDIIFRRFTLGFSKKQLIAIYADGLVSSQLQGESVFNPIMALKDEGKHSGSDYEMIKESLIAVGEITEHGDMWEACIRALAGDTVLLIEGTEQVLSINTRYWPERAVEDPVSEVAVRGAKEGFTENLQSNIAQVRRRLKHPDLTFEALRGGSFTNTDLAVAYIRGVVNPKFVEEVHRRIRRTTHTDSILESGNIEELIEDNPYSPFPQIEHTERPDKAAAQLLEGRVVIFTDTTPLVLMVPTLFWQFIQSTDDYYERIFGSFLRIMRTIALLFALFLPSLYVALTTYHQEMLPFALLVSINAAREGVPFPAFMEAFFMEVIFEFLREAGIRLPMQIGQAVTIVGALIIGEAAIMANLVSPAMVIVVAGTGIASFVIPAFNAAISLRLLRFVVLILASALGLFGIMIAAVVLLTHLVSLRSFGVPYMSPLAPLNLRDLKDVFLRLPKWSHDKRPHALRTRDTRRQDIGLKPEPGRD